MNPYNCGVIPGESNALTSKCVSLPPLPLELIALER